MFTGNKDTDYEILYNLNDHDLGHTCQINHYTRELCKNDTFWMNRTLRRFFPILNAEELKNYKHQNGFETWRSYYIDLVNSMENYYQDPIKNETRDRDDYNKIVNYIWVNTRKYSKCYETETPNCSIEWLQKDFIDLNHMFNVLLDTHFTEEQKWELIIKIFDVVWFKINPISIESFYSAYGGRAVDVLIKKNSKEVRHDILSNMLIVSADDNNIIFDKIFPYIESPSEILDPLFERIREGYGMEKKDIVLFLDKAVEKGSSKGDIEHFYEFSKGFGGRLEEYEEESYDDAMRVVNKYLKNMKIGKNVKRDKIDLIVAKLQSKKYSDKIYTKILKLLD